MIPRSMVRAPVLATLALALAIFAGCSAESGQANPPGPASATVGAAKDAPPAQTGGSPDIAGLWEGTSLATCGALVSDQNRCGAVNKVTFTFLQDGAQITGHYTCGFGNQDCRNMDENGKIEDGKLESTLLTMRVQMRDGSDCMFSGQPKGDAIEGGYSCSQGGGLLEQGYWNARRSY
ncbi:MAG TPA: hypothetical protein VNF45_05690 [Candidatus Binataceae bacterium]|nr:hypothetical protein [Candidatus Binataceae bacterium]